jgi:hypothetical protein
VVREEAGVTMAAVPRAKAKLYKRYPWTTLAVYHGSTILHFALGGAGIMVGYAVWGWPAYLLSAAYLAFAFAEMYVLMPLAVCPRCVYYRWQGSLCVSGLNTVARRLARAGRPEDFARRAEGLLCPNNLYLASLILPILALVPAMLLRITWVLPALLVALLALLITRFLLIIPKLACLHCQAKFTCPQAGMMGVRDR